MSKRIAIIVSAAIVLGVAFFLATARQKFLHKPGVTAPAVAP
jgi:hypothetical protein